MSEPIVRTLASVASPQVCMPYDGVAGAHLFTATVSGSGSVSAAVAVEGSNDLIGWASIVTLSPSGSGSAVASASTSSSYRYVRANVSAVTGQLIVKMASETVEADVAVPPGMKPVYATLSGLGLGKSIDASDSSGLVHAVVSSSFGYSGSPIPPALRTSNTSNVWVEKSVTTAESKAGSYWAYVPVGNGDYNVFGIGSWLITGAEVHVGRMTLGRIGSYTHHNDAKVTTSGTWVAGSAPLNTYCACGPDGVMSTIYSVTAGSQAIFTGQVGHTLIARTVGTTVGGYAIVAIDGDWTAANLCRSFTAADYSAGRCRSSDVGKRYIMIGSVAVWPDHHIPLAEGLADTAHTVTFEATNTRHENAAITQNRAYICGVIACSSADVGKSLVKGSVVIGQLRPVNDVRGKDSSAMHLVPFVRDSTSTAQPLGETHANATQESFKIWLDGEDISSRAAGYIAQGLTLQAEVVATLANTNAPATPVIRKTMTYTFCASSLSPLVTSWEAAFLVDKEVEYCYPMMLPIMVGMEVPSGALTVDSGSWDQAMLGSNEFFPNDFAQNVTGSDIQLPANQPALVGIVGSTQHRSVAYVACLDGGASFEHFSRVATESCFFQRRSKGGNKLYFASSTARGRRRYKAGEIIRGVVGYGIKPAV